MFMVYGVYVCCIWCVCNVYDVNGVWLSAPALLSAHLWQPAQHPPSQHSLTSHLDLRGVASRISNEFA